MYYQPCLYFMDLFVGFLGFNFVNTSEEKLVMDVLSEIK